MKRYSAGAWMTGVSAVEPVAQSVFVNSTVIFLGVAVVLAVGLTSMLPVAADVLLTVAVPSVVPSILTVSQGDCPP